MCAHSSYRCLYWTDWSDGTPRIVKTSMDGSNVTVLANRTWVTWPNALAIDYTNQILYWGDASRDVIGRVGTNGAGIQIIANLTALQSSRNHPWAMSYYNGQVYWSDWLNGKCVHKMDVSSSDRRVETIVSGLSENPTGIHVVDASRQAAGERERERERESVCVCMCTLVLPLIHYSGPTVTPPYSAISPITHQKIITPNYAGKDIQFLSAKQCCNNQSIRHCESAETTPLPRYR